MHQRQSKQTKILAPDPRGVDRGLYEDLLHRIGGDFSTIKQLRLVRLNWNIPNDSAAVCLRSPSATVVTRRCGGKTSGTSGRKSEAPASCRSAGQDRRPSGTAPPTPAQQAKRSGSIYRKIDTYNLWPLSSLFRAPGSSISTCKRSHQRNTLPVRLWPGGCSFQFGRTSMWRVQAQPIASLALLRMQQHTNHAGIAHEFDALCL